MRGLEQLLASRARPSASAWAWSGWRPARGARSPGAAVPRDPRRRHQRQDVDRAASAPPCSGAHGLAAGAYLSPHVHGFAERVQLDGEPLGEELLAAAVEQVEAVAPAVERQAGEPLTQFEALTAAAFLALATAARRGRGGRGRARRPLRRHERAGRARRAAAPASGSTTRRSSGPRARPSPARSSRSSTPARGSSAAASTPRSAPVLERLAREHAAPWRCCCCRRAPTSPTRRRWPRPAPSSAPTSRWRWPAASGCRASPSTAGARSQAAAAVRVPGRLETVGTAPLTVLDGAHNPHAAAALAAELPALLGERRPRVLVVAILADKDAERRAARARAARRPCHRHADRQPPGAPGGGSRGACRGGRAGRPWWSRDPGVGTGPGAGRRGPGRRRARDRLAVAAGRPAAAEAATGVVYDGSRERPPGRAHVRRSRSS